MFSKPKHKSGAQKRKERKKGAGREEQEVFYCPGKRREHASSLL